MPPTDLPPALVKAILRGRCVAFVGAGFSAIVTPTWPELLAGLAQELAVAVEFPERPSGFDYEAIGQYLQDQAGTARWEKAVQVVLARRSTAAGDAAHAVLAKRIDLLHSIPFKAIFTTNFDPSLEGEPTKPQTNWRVLREQQGSWFLAPDRASRARPATPIIKLHGHANGDPTDLPLVLSRTDYRRRLYEEHNYGNLIRAVFAGYTILFLGVSFTDAYLNELRSEILNLVGCTDGADTWGYSIQFRPTAAFARFLQDHEGISVLPTQAHDEFDQWLEIIAAKTSLSGRLRTLLAGKRVVWFDDDHDNNEEGRALLHECGAQIVPLGTKVELSMSEHAGADLILTSFGFHEGRAFELLDRLRHWQTRPPVIVFAAPGKPAQLAHNRRECLRRGAWEFTTEWSELYRAIEQVIGRVPGQRSFS